MADCNDCDREWAHSFRRLVAVIAGAALPASLRDSALADLEEEYLLEIRPTRSALGALLWYCRESCSLGSRFVWARLRRKPHRTFASLPRFEGEPIMQSWLQDVRYAARSLARRPGFALAATASLALGIGANTAVFSLVNAVLLAPLPFEEPQQIVVPNFDVPSRGMNGISVSYPDFLDWREQTDVFEHVVVFDGVSLDLAGDGDPRRISGREVSGGYFELFGAGPLVGRVFAADDFVPGRQRVVVIDKALWQARFGGRNDILGRKLEMSGVRYEIIGVVDSESVWPGQAEFWIPLYFGDPPPDWLMRRDNFFLRAVARLKAGVDRTQALARVETLNQRAIDESPDKRQGIEVRLPSLSEWIVGPQLRTALLAVQVAVGFVLLIVCVNVANLMLARTGTRSREMGIRTALGAGPARLMRLILSESALLAVAGGAAGALIAVAFHRLLVAIPQNLPRIDQAAIDSKALFFALGLSALTVLLFGIVPALKLRRIAVNESLSEAGRGLTAGPQRLRGVLVAAEVALSLALLVGAGLMINSLLHLYGRDPGIRINKVLTVGVRLPSARYPGREQQSEFFDNLLERVRVLPGVRSAAAASTLPLGAGGSLIRAHLVEGAPPPPEGPEFLGVWTVTTPDYFKTLGIPVLQGRFFDHRDRSEGVPVVIINQTLSRQMFPDGNPVGKRIKSWRDEDLLREVVGVVGDVRPEGLSGDQPGMVYIPYRQGGGLALRGLVIHTDGDPLGKVEGVRRQVVELDAKLPLTNIVSMEQIYSNSLAGNRYFALLLGIFASTALFLAAIGIYGVVSYIFGRRTRELGIRLAMGAKKGDLIALVMKSAVTMAVLGMAAGLLPAMAAGRALSALLTDVGAFDPLTYAAGGILLMLVALAAGLAPALKASHIDPVQALRSE